ncbi:hypothetical protein KBY22_05060 [Ruegeria pomeroyi]|uniref:Uncharacterized protein n=1 Tax=Ruegeria alba TaxID=2916756 RepID=A0ABS9NU23_9RHOB|nr:hypothetical protein [Ruegeria alba]MCE8512049.1 hypothetical protein [Ruegeria pomeroyi]MCE8524829.1 hypothetical protein [Ruegeria pomeroyi]MCE8528631.1 hypothetical protein [Ruegeria pomeroyi]MCG6557424.1 hypothetical protein [Ruegeria alba]
MTRFDHILIPGFVLLASALLIQISGLTLLLGAHPWWAQKVIWIGLPIGIGLAMTAWALRLPRPLRQLGFGLSTFVAFLIAEAGKTQFTASVAENIAAGQTWYLGWIATCALITATLASLFRYSQ